MKSFQSKTFTGKIYIRTYKYDCIDMYLNGKQSNLTYLSMKKIVKIIIKMQI